MLEKSIAALRSTLEGQGLTVERLTVHVAPPGGQQFLRDDGNSSMNQHARQHHHHDAANGESRGRRDEQPDQSRRHYPVNEFASVLDGLEQFRL